MDAEQWATLRQLCRDEAAFEQVKAWFTTAGVAEPSVQCWSATARERRIIQLIGKLGQAIISRIRQCQDLDETLKTVIEELQGFLGADRVAIYRFKPDWSGEFIAEAVAEPWLPLLQRQHDIPRLKENISDCSLRTLGKTRTLDTYIQATQGAPFQFRTSLVAVDIEQMGFSECYLQALRQYEVRSYAIAPIFQEDTLWGLLAAYQNGAPRQWEESEVNLLTQVANQFGSALELAQSLQAVQRQEERKQVIVNISNRIHQSLDLEAILRTTTQEVRYLLQADRVAVYRFNSDWTGQFVSESVAQGWGSLVDPEMPQIWEDTYLQETQGGRYRLNETFAVNNIYAVGHMPCHIELLEQFQAKAYAIAPIFVGKTLWGLLAAYQNANTRVWHPNDINLLAQIGVQLGVALQQAELFTELHAEVEERQQAEQTIRHLNWDLRRRNVELETINRELEAFAYSVSHDLRTPLRAIDGFSQALWEDFYADLDDQGKDYLQRIRNATQRMGELIDDLLLLSRVSRSDVNYATINLSEIAGAIAAELQQSAPERQVTFTIQEGLVVRADLSLMSIVLNNLFDNAWKFTSKHERAEIEFGMKRREDGNLIYFVRDDGAGFDMAYVGKLFGAFQRLHGINEFAGTGIGLATIQRIIHRHGGKVWAEGAVEQGATFYFTLAEFSASGQP